MRYLIITTALFLISCQKSEINNAPEVSTPVAEKLQVMPGERILIQSVISDPDNDDLNVTWSTAKGEILSSNIANSCYWKAPNSEGLHNISVEVNDLNVKLDRTTSVEVMGYVFSQFDTVSPSWNAENAGVQVVRNHYEATPVNPASDLKVYHFIDDRIEPPYTLHLSAGLADAANFAAEDKYGLHLDFFNAGADTLVKEMWFRLYPNSSTKNWKLSVYKDTGSSSVWQNIASDAIGTAGSISSNPGDLNQLELTVDSAHNCSLLVAGQLIYSTAALRDSFLVEGVAPKLKLKSIGLRSSNGAVQLDDVFLTKSHQFTHSEIFN